MSVCVRIYTCTYIQIPSQSYIILLVQKNEISMPLLKYFSRISLQTSAGILPLICMGVDCYWSARKPPGSLVCALKPRGRAGGLFSVAMQEQPLSGNLKLL